LLVLSRRISGDLSAERWFEEQRFVGTGKGGEGLEAGASWIYLC
jgi:hypothetical protein